MSEEERAKHKKIREKRRDHHLKNKPAKDAGTE